MRSETRHWESAREGDCSRALALAAPAGERRVKITARSGRAYLNGLLIAAPAGRVLR
jgi:hypothetical protein